MLKQLVEYILSLLNLARDTRTNKEEIVELRRELDELASAMERLSFEVRLVREEGRHERDKLLLRLENAITRLERQQLPSPKDPKRLK